ncbi:MAG: hypothetical protein P8X90_08570 [Desulfobacterales bacterium]
MNITAPTCDSDLSHQLNIRRASGIVEDKIVQDKINKFGEIFLKIIYNLGFLCRFNHFVSQHFNMQSQMIKFIRKWQGHRCLTDLRFNVVDPTEIFIQMGGHIILQQLWVNLRKFFIPAVYLRSEAPAVNHRHDSKKW